MVNVKLTESNFPKFIKALVSLTIPGAEAFRETFTESTKPDIKVMTLGMCFNGPPYAEIVSKLFDEIMSR